MKPLSVRRLLLALVAIIALGMAVSPVMVNAQGNNCYGLGDADCQLLTASMNAPKGSMASFTLNYSVDSKTTGASKGDTTFTLTGSASFQADGGISGIASPDTLTNPNIQRLRQSLGKLSLQDTTDTQITRNGKTAKYQFELRLVSSKLYINSTQITKGSWEVLDLRTMLPLLSRAGRSAGTSPSLEGTEQAAGADSGRGLAILGDFKALLQVPNAFTAERGADMTIDNQTIAVFVFHVNLATLLGSSQFMQLVKDSQAQNPSKTPMTDDQLKTALTQLVSATQNLKIDISRYVGTTDKLSHGFGLDVTGTVDASALQQNILPLGVGSLSLGSASGSASSGAAATGTVTVDTHLKFTLSGIGSPVKVTAPAGAKPFNFGGLLTGSVGTSS